MIHKTYEDVQKLSIVQMEILQKVSELVRPGGQLVYCTCSLQYEEGEAQVDRFLSKNTGFNRDPISLHEIGSVCDAINVNGDLRLLPYHLNQNEGVDGFFASRLTRK